MSQYDSMGRLTRDGAVKVIAGGGSVSIGGRLYASIDSLPGEADFAKGDKVAEQSARERLQKTIDDAKAQLTSLDATQPSKVATVSAGTTPPTDNLDSLGIEDLRVQAKERGIPHYWSMSQDKLVVALREKA